MQYPSKSSDSNALHIGSIVHIAGFEWPGSEWDRRDAWYIGEIADINRSYAYVKFDDYEKPLRFSKSSLREYQRLYREFLFGVLLDTAELSFHGIHANGGHYGC